MKQKLQQFMIGRYGVDELSKVMLYVTLGLCILSMFIRSSILSILLAWGLVVIYFRMFSKNYQKRYQENLKYLQFKDKIVHFFRREKNIVEQKKIYRIYTCPSCKQKVRIPKGKGKVCVTCPKCRTEFVKRS